MTWPTAYLHGNSEPCTACDQRRELLDAAPVIREVIPCNVCGGKGYLPLRAAEIVRRTVEQGRQADVARTSQRAPDQDGA